MQFARVMWRQVREGFTRAGLRQAHRNQRIAGEEHGMVARALTVAFNGVQAEMVEVQVLIAPGMAAFTIVGLPDKAVAESRERIRAALHAAGLALPPKRITVNLSPADLPKEGSHYDLPIAVALLAAMGVLPSDFAPRFICMGELALDGGIRPVHGVLPAAMTALADERGIICPAANGGEAAWAGEGLDIVAADTLVQLVNHAKGTLRLPRPPCRADDGEQAAMPDLRDVRGQESAKRALEVAAAGGHHMLMMGPPGAGKSMLAARLPSILPPMTAREMLETSVIASLAGMLPNGVISRQRPFRAPHHTASPVALAGGGHGRARPGEMSLAHNGVLFLDELPEFAPRVLEVLRQPLENGEVLIARANYRVVYPARFQLLAAMNPCKCGLAFEPGHSCRRGEHCARDYMGRISGPLLDRFDLRIQVPAVDIRDLSLPPAREGSAEVAERVAAARTLQQQRYAALGLAHVRTNAQAPAAVLEEVAAMPAQARTLLQQAAEKLRLSARGYHRVLRLARTIADLAGAQSVQRAHVAEALAYRGHAPGMAAAA